uniref:sodium channel protein type 4 subunit alpha B-like isoform X2 n=1 Tax=Ciona intestinalis TaxID=7719 RepID=UPI000180C1C6|nr:sodium channel protein type 4 subunit alpha B-like isoform X2 [Ciona intestinalis]|eukprot:XP_026692353.1 sodium channel protein type 4 subunit alpha B-like isoform X2 [Ciona intestinalis]
MNAPTLRERICSFFCDGACLRPRDPEYEQKIYLKERKRIEKYLQNLEEPKSVDRSSPVPILPEPEPEPEPESDKRITDPQRRFSLPVLPVYSLKPNPPPNLRRRSVWFECPAGGGGEPVITVEPPTPDEMPLRLIKRRVGDRRNAMGRESHRKSLMKGILSVASGGGTPPVSELKEGKPLPGYLGRENETYCFPACAGTPLKEPDEFYEDKTYIVVNDQGSIFRFSKAESLFLFGQESRLRNAAINLFIKPMFSNFIMLVILFNCACMVLENPPHWVDDYLEYVFTAIYIAEATVKITARGFVLHSFSYLRDPWNWLDFIVIVSALATEILKAIVRSTMLGQIAVLRTFRVLRALKTMSVVPGLRGIVKALLRSIHALKDAVALTVFCVSVFALIGYQLFHGTLRQKCVLSSNSPVLAPDALYALDKEANFFRQEFDFASACLKQDFNESYNDSSHYNTTPVQTLTPLYPHPKDCHLTKFLPPCDGTQWCDEDVIFIERILTTVNNTLTKAVNQSEQHCVSQLTMPMYVSAWSSLAYKVGLHIPSLNNGTFECANSTSNSTSAEPYCNTMVHMDIADITCLRESQYGGNGSYTSHNASKDLKHWGSRMAYGCSSVPKWYARKLIISLRIVTPNNKSSPELLFYSSDPKAKDLTQWKDDVENHCMTEPTTGLYYFPMSSNRPKPEPIYCAIGNDDMCPLGYGCYEAGGNPDYGYTSFDHFFLAFLTSFRLVALDSWSRLYYLTLHTIGKTYAIFYIVVVLLGSYYLVNLILAVVYMAYEEQQAVVEEEELEAKEREAEKREQEGDDLSECDDCASESDVPNSEIDVETGRWKMGLITTSLACHEPRQFSNDGNSSATFSPSPFGYKESCRRKRRRMRLRSQLSSRTTLHQPSGDDEPSNQPTTLHKRSQRSSSLRYSVRSHGVQSSDTCTCSDDSSMYQHGDMQRPKRRRSLSKSRRRRYRRKSPVNLKSLEENKKDKHEDKPSIRLIVTEIESEAESGHRMLKNKQENHHEKNANFLSVNEALRRGRMSSLSSETSSCNEVCNDCSEQNNTEKKPCFNPGCCNSKFSSTEFSFRRLSDSSSMWGDNESEQVVEVEIAQDENIGRKLPVRSPTTNKDTENQKPETLPSHQHHVIHTKKHSPNSLFPAPTNTHANRLKTMKGCNTPPMFLRNELRKDGNGSCVNGSKTNKGSHVGIEDDYDCYLMENKFGMGPAEYFQTNNNLLSPVNPSPVKTTGDPAADDINIDEDQTIAVISEDGKYYEYQENYDVVQLEEKLDETSAMLTDQFSDISPTSRRARWKLKNKKMTDRYQKFSRAFVNLFCKWRCCPAGWSKIQRKVRRIVLNPFTDLLITLCIALNTLFMSLEQHPMEAWFAKILDNANVFFTIVFTVEMLMKIIGLSPYTYFNERWNVFDAVVVLFSLLELLLNSTQGLSVFRAFRLMRILKLAKQWPTLNKLLRIIGKTLGQLWHLTLVLFLVLFIFAVVGMQLLRESYISHYLEHNQGKLPRWNFIDFPHSFMVVFRIQCGEWVENMFTCLNVAPPGICIPLFILVYIIGNLVILNLFLALLLNSFSGDVLQQTTSENSSISEAFRQFVAWARKQRSRIQTIPFNTFCCQMVKLGVRNTPKNPMKMEVKKTMSQSSECNVITNTEMTTFTAITEDKDSNGDACADETDPMLQSPKPHTNGNASHDKQSGTNHKTNHEPCNDNTEVSVLSLNGSLKEPSKSRNDSVCAIVQESNDLLNNPNKETCKEKRSRSVTPEGRCSSRVSRRRNSMTSRASESSSIPLSPTSSSHRRRKASVSARDRYRGIRSSVGEGSGGEGIKENGREDKLTNKNHNQVQDEDKTESVEEENEVNETENEKSKLQPCFSCWTREPLSGPWFEMREFMHKIIIHRYFENIVIFCILLSTVTLAMEDIHIDKRPAMKKVVHIIDIFCCIFFTVEMLMKWIGKGLRSYFTNPWCCLDFFIVLVSLVNIFMASNQRADFSALRALRTFRALRPLRALSRFQGMKIVVDALIRAVPSITHVFFICMIFWLIFSILGVNIFGGRFGRCVSLMTGDIMPNPRPEDIVGNNTIYDKCLVNNTLLFDYLRGIITSRDISSDLVLPIIRNRTECELCANMMNTTLINWQIPSVNFDSAPRGLLALLQIATFTGWIEIMGSAIDITGIESQPRYENSFYNYLYFCVFIIFGAFFSLNLFIGVIIDNFNQQKIKTKGGEDGVFLTDEQRRYYNAMKRMASKTPKKPIPRPNSRFANKIYDIVTDRKFEIAVMGLIMLNLVVMAIEHHDMSPEMYKLLQNFNLGFICVFLLEAILKLIGLRLYYFTVPWNVFDILVVVVSLIASGLHDVMTQYFVQPTIFRIIRLFRVTRILRLIREAKGIRTLLFALMMSLPALFNIGSLLFLLMFIYAIIGMSQFPYIQKVAGVDDLLNFETFPNAFLVLFQISTSEGWDTFIDPVLRDREPYCDESPADGSPSNCGNATVGVIYFVTYVMITFLIVVNMYIAIILENFEVATRESAEPLTADDFEQFFEVWQRFDDRLTQFVTYEQLKLLLHQLDFPLRVALPNTAFISQAHMKVTLDGRIHCLEVIITLIKKVLGDSPELNNLKDSMLQSFKLKCPAKESLEDQETIDSEEFTVQLRAVIIIQRAYREYRLRIEELEYSEEGDMTDANSSESSSEPEATNPNGHTGAPPAEISIEPPG